jgi:hypothetical protein
MRPALGLPDGTHCTPNIPFWSAFEGLEMENIVFFWYIVGPSGIFLSV